MFKKNIAYVMFMLLISGIGNLWAQAAGKPLKLGEVDGDGFRLTPEAFDWSLVSWILLAAAILVAGMVYLFRKVGSKSATSIAGLVVVLLLLAGDVAQAASVNTLNPPQSYIGFTNVLVLTGDKVDQVKSVKFGGKGVRVIETQKPSGGKISLKISVGDNATPWDKYWFEVTYNDGKVERITNPALRVLPRDALAMQTVLDERYQLKGDGPINPLPALQKTVMLLQEEVVKLQAAVKAKPAVQAPGKTTVVHQADLALEARVRQLETRLHAAEEALQKQKSAGDLTEVNKRLTDLEQRPTGMSNEQITTLVTETVNTVAQRLNADVQSAKQNSTTALSMVLSSQDRQARLADLTARLGSTSVESTPWWSLGMYRRKKPLNPEIRDEAKQIKEEISPPTTTLQQKSGS